MRGLLVNMPKSGMGDGLISIKELQRKLSWWPLAASHEHILLMTSAAF